MISAESLRTQFPILQRTVQGKPLVYLDNAATTQKPQVMIDALVDYYSNHNANVHRGVHTLSDESTEVFLQSHARIAKFFGAKSEQLIFTRNTTEAMNNLAWGLRRQVAKGDVIVTTLQDHHSSLVPWQQVAQERGALLVSLPLDATGVIDWHASQTLLEQNKKKLKVIILPLVSNVLGTISPLSQLNQWLRDAQIRDQVCIVADAAQAAPHLKISLETFGLDAIVFSGHKLYGPMGSGGAVLRLDLLDQLEPALTGGGMIDTVTPTNATFSLDLIDRFTAGTPDVASMAGLAAAVEWLDQWPYQERLEREHDVLKYAWEKLKDVPHVQLVGPAVTEDPLSRIGVISWVYDRVHAHDVAQILDRCGVAVRSGHHCTMPLHTAMQWQATCRASVALYNTRSDIDVLIEGLAQVEKTFSRSFS